MSDERVVGFTAGVFDLFPVGHLNLLEESRKRCDWLVVGVIADEVVETFKHVKPFVCTEERARIVGALKCVDEVVVIRDERYLSKVAVWYDHPFDVTFTGDDHEGEPFWQDEEQMLATLGARIEYLPYTRGTSSTQLRAALRDRA